MKKKLFPVLALCGAMLVPAMPVDAAYTGADEIAVSARVIDTGKGAVMSADAKTAYVYADTAAAGTVLHFGVFIEAERAEISLMGAKLVTDGGTLTFDAPFSPTTVYYDEPQTFTLPDGTFTTDYKPYCLGKLNSAGDYSPSCFTCNVHADPADNSLTAYWMYGIGQQTAFLGGQSDLFSFVEFDVHVAPGTEPGSYHLDFVTDPDEDARQAETDHLTFIVSDNGTPEKSVYHNIIPAMKGAQIVILDSGIKGDLDHDGAVTAADAAEILIYAANVGAGEPASLSGSDNEADEMLAFSLADVSGDGLADASDAAALLQYAAAVGAGEDAAWEDFA